MESYYNNETILFWNCEFVKATEAKIDLYSQSLHYGYSVFEGIRAYKTSNGETKIFKASEHYARLKNSADAMNMPYSFSYEALVPVIYQLLAINYLQDAYIRPLI